MLMDTNGHTILSEDYVSFEVAKLLKDKGFDGDVHVYYHIWDNGNNVCFVQEFSHSEAPHLYIPAPTHQIACKWLREKHDLMISINYSYVFNSYSYTIKFMTGRELAYSNIAENYEEAVEAAIKYTLENLI